MNPDPPAAPAPGTPPGSRATAAITKYVQTELDRLHARFPGYVFWHVPTSHGPDAWCWRPPGGTARDSQHRGSPEEAEAAILGTETRIRRPRPKRTKPGKA